MFSTISTCLGKTENFIFTEDYSNYVSIILNIVMLSKSVTGDKCEAAVFTGGEKFLITISVSSFRRCFEICGIKLFLFPFNSVFRVFENNSLLAERVADFVSANKIPVAPRRFSLLDQFLDLSRQNLFF